MVIVTQNQYILASKIHHVTMDESTNHQEIYLGNGRRKTITERFYQISVIYTPEDISNNISLSNNRNNNETRECTVNIRGAVNAHLVFKNLIQQIREQMPDQLYLDTAMERMIAGINMEDLQDRDVNSKLPELETKDDRKPKKIRRARKTKRASKAVLRKSKKRR